VFDKFISLKIQNNIRFFAFQLLILIANGKLSSQLFLFAVIDFYANKRVLIVLRKLR